MKHQNRVIRIIGGKWRGRKVRFPENDLIRPTGDRIRETLFNWLMHETAGSACLDLYAGSGALGIEALSRGAKNVTFVENDKQTANQLRRAIQELEGENYEVRSGPALDFLAETDQKFDLIFLDPPFDSNELQRALTIISSRELATGFVYIETDAAPISQLPEKWAIYREKTAGSVHYCLVDLRAGASV